jgi:predicted GNAT superfamily acetyltransferase
VSSPPLPDIATLWCGSLLDLADLEAATDLYQSVFAYSSAAAGLNTRLLRSLALNGGSVVGAKTDDGRLVAFGYGYLGSDADCPAPYHYSQAVVVHPDFQGAGLGRRLKLAQRDTALASGAVSMRWSYDPALARNAHFNLDVLGAVGRWFAPDMYGTGRSDRLIVEWALVSEPARRPEPPAAPNGLPWGELVVTQSHSWLALPAEIADLRAADPERAATVEAQISAAVVAALDAGRWAVSCRRTDPGTAAYCFAPADRLP